MNTPRTDEEEKRFNHVDSFNDQKTVPADFARQLEHELIEAYDTIAALESEIISLSEQCPPS